MFAVLSVYSAYSPAYSLRLALDLAQSHRVGFQIPQTSSTAINAIEMQMRQNYRRARADFQFSLNFVRFTASFRGARASFALFSSPTLMKILE